MYLAGGVLSLEQIPVQGSRPEDIDKIPYVSTLIFADK